MPGAHLHADVWINEAITPYDVYSHGVTKIRAAADTPFQAMQIVETGVYGVALVLDGKWQSCTGDEFLYHEPLVHPALTLRAASAGPPKTVLVLGGGEGATVRECLRWSSVERVTMVDIDGIVVEACKQHLPEMHRGAFADPRTDLVIADAIEYIKDSGTRPAGGWDVIISDLSDPIEEGPSYRLFTREYFADLKAILADRGVLVVQSGCVSPAEMRLHCRLSRTLRDLFPVARTLQSTISTYPAPWSFLVCAEDDVAELDPGRVDAILAEHVRSFNGTELRAFDGTALVGMTRVPKHLRDAIEAEDTVFTMDNPPKAFSAETVNTMG